MLVGGALLAACEAAPGPRGWAGAQPVRVGDRNVLLVPHRSHLYALNDGSGTGIWEFPPKDKNSYPASLETQSELKRSLSDASLTDPAFTQKVDNLTVSGPTGGDLKNAISGSQAGDDVKSRLRNEIDSKLDFEKKSLGGLKALYGEIGLSADGDTVYVPTFKGRLFALDTENGHLRWVRDVGAGMVGGVAVDGDTIYVGTKGSRVRALDAETGDQRWEFSTNGEVWSTPAVDGSTVYVTSLDGSVYALDAASGSPNWTFSGADSGIAASAVIEGDSLYVGAFDNKLYSIKKSDGTMNWSVSADNWFWSTPAVEDGVVYAAALDGKVYAVSAETGEAHWPRPFDTGAAIRSGLVIAGGGVMVAARDGEVYKLNLDSGEPSEGSPVRLVNAKVLSNLTLNGDDEVLVSPTSAVLYVIDPRGALGAPGSYPLPR